MIIGQGTCIPGYLSILNSDATNTRFMFTFRYLRRLEENGKNGKYMTKPKNKRMTTMRPLLELWQAWTSSSSEESYWRLLLRCCRPAWRSWYRTPMVNFSESCSFFSCSAWDSCWFCTFWHLISLFEITFCHLFLTTSDVKSSTDHYFTPLTHSSLQCGWVCATQTST